LRSEAFTAIKLEAQLDDAMAGFINDPVRNHITPQKAELSEIFKWFKGDFERDGKSVRDFINRFSTVKITDQTEITHLDYNWKLNEK
jgi:hypothetical protein